MEKYNLSKKLFWKLQKKWRMFSGIFCTFISNVINYIQVYYKWNKSAYTSVKYFHIQVLNKERNMFQ